MKISQSQITKYHILLLGKDYVRVIIHPFSGTLK